MNGIDKITQRIAEDAQAEAQAILKRAEAEAGDLLAQAEAEAQQERAEALSRAQQTAREEAARTASMTQLEGRKRLLSAKQDLIAQAFDKALMDLIRLPQSEQVELLAAMAARAAVTGREEVIFSADDRGVIGQQVVDKANAKLSAGKLTLSEQTRPITGGFILESDGVEINCAYETLVRLARSPLERETAHILFGA